MNFIIFNYNTVKHEPQEFFDLYLSKIQGEVIYVSRI